MSESVAVNYLRWGSSLGIDQAKCVSINPDVDDVMTEEQRKKYEERNKLRRVQEQARYHACAIIQIAENLLLNGASVNHAYAVAEEFIERSEKLLSDALTEVECTGMD